MLRPLLCCALLCCAPLFLAACSKPQPPEKEHPVEPQAQKTGAVVQAINAPLDKAKSVQDTLDKAAEQEQAEIDRQTQ